MSTVDIGVSKHATKLIGVALVYITLALILSYSYVAAGEEPPPFLPGFVQRSFAATIDTWNRVRGLTVNASMVDVAVAVYNLSTSSMQLLLEIMVTAVFVYVWIAYQVTLVLPYPLSVLSIPVWVFSVMTTWVMTVWLLQSVLKVIGRIIPRY